MSPIKLPVILFAAATLAAVAVPQAQQPTNPPHQHPAETAKPQKSDMMAKCKAMMANHDKMMAEVKAADERLDGLVAKMNAASGQAKVDATAAAVSEVVTQRKSMRESMMKMQHEAMGHMMEHSQAGKESMAMCPMMKDMGAMMKK